MKTDRFALTGLVALLSGVWMAGVAAEEGTWYQGQSSGFRGLSPDSQIFEGALGMFGLSPFGGPVEGPLIDKHYTGYRFSDLFALEGAQSQLSLSPGGCHTDRLAGDLAAPCHGAAWSVTGVATLPFEEGLSLYGRLGMQYWQPGGTGEGLPWRNGAADVGATYGIGVSYEFRKDWYLHAESERFSELSQGTGLRLDRGLGLDSAVHSIGLSVRF